MALDPSIALGVKPVELQNPLTQYGQVAQLQAAQNQNALAQYQLSAAKRADELTNATNELYSKHFNPATGKVNMNALSGELAAKGFGAQIPVLQAKQQELEGKEATTSKTKADAAEKRKKFADDLKRDLSLRPSDANITAYLEDIQASDLFSPQEKLAAERDMKGLLALPLPQRAEKLSLAGATASDYTTRRGQNMTQATAIRGQDLVDARAKERNDLKPVPVHAQKAITGAVSSLAQIDKAIADLKANPDAVGLKGLTPDIALNRMDPEGTAARASLADIGSLKIHERSGAAVTASETPRLKPFIPSITDDYDTALKKLERMREIQAAEQEVLTGTYNRDQGFRDFTSPAPTGTPPANPTKPAAPAAVSNVVTLPNGSSMTFPDAKSAAAFKKKAGL